MVRLPRCPTNLIRTSAQPSKTVSAGFLWCYVLAFASQADHCTGWWRFFRPFFMSCPAGQTSDGRRPGFLTWPGTRPVGGGEGGDDTVTHSPPAMTDHHSDTGDRPVCPQKGAAPAPRAAQTLRPTGDKTFQGESRQLS